MNDWYEKSEKLSNKLQSFIEKEVTKRKKREKSEKWGKIEAKMSKRLQKLTKVV
jgi:hypothetical protein